MSDESDLRIFEKVQFRGLLEQAAQQPEFMRVDSMMMYLRARLVSPYLTQDECFIAVYGSDGALKFWEVLCAEPIELRCFVNLFATTRAQVKDEQEPIRVNLWAAMLAAYQAGETWFVGDTTPFEGATYGGQVARATGHDKLKVWARGAAEWLLRMPRRRHLVPDWVATILRPAPIEGAAAEPPTDQGPVIVSQTDDRGHGATEQRNGEASQI